MSKSKGNVTGPGELADAYGADAVRLYILFMGPADQDMEWTEEGVGGISRFLKRLGHERLWARPWPEADPALLERETFELVIQVNGRVRDRVEVSTDASDEELLAQAKASARVQEFLDGKEIRKEIVVPGKLVNLVVG